MLTNFNVDSRVHYDTEDELVGKFTLSCLVSDDVARDTMILTHISKVLIRVHAELFGFKLVKRIADNGLLNNCTSTKEVAMELSRAESGYNKEINYPYGCLVYFTIVSQTGKFNNQYRFSLELVIQPDIVGQESEVAEELLFESKMQEYDKTVRKYHVSVDMETRNFQNIVINEVEEEIIE